MTKVYIHLEPGLCDPELMAGATAVVIDVLRATTTMIYALAAGAREIRPCLSVERARELAASYPPGAALLGGERQGRQIEGFQLGNSPSEYRKNVVRDKSIVFTTTNGTRALDHARCARTIFLAGFVNAHAVVLRLLREPGDVHVICAGTDRQVTREDALLAGLIAWGCMELNIEAGRPMELGNDSAALAVAVSTIVMDRWDEDGDETQTQQWLADELANSQGGKNLIAIGLAEDLSAAARMNLFAMVPEYDAATGVVKIGGG